MCDFTDYGIAEDKLRMKKRIVKKRKTGIQNLSSEKVQEEREENIIITQ